MRFLLLHLSDMHIASEDDVVLARREALVRATRNLDYEVEHGLIAVSGDVANSGSEDEYLVAWQFLSDIAAQLSKDLSRPNCDPVPVNLAIIPGNHDCDLRYLDRAREKLGEDALSDFDLATDSSVVRVCTDSQRSFFEFLDAAAAEGRLHTKNGFDPHLYWEYSFQAGRETVRFLCCNTAWVPGHDQEQGSLYFPPEAVPASTDGDSLVLTLLHHPYNWLEHNCARALRKRVDAVSDLVLTGHEHDASWRTQSDTHGTHNTYVEGGALQESGDRSFSTFNVFVIDTGQQRQKFLSLQWQGSHYIPVNSTSMGDEGAGLSWTEYSPNRYRSHGLFELNPAMREFLNDPGVTLVHRSRDAIVLPDIYVFPDLREVRYPPPEGPTGIVRGEDVPDLVNGMSHLVISGDTQSGKTSLAKTIFSYLRDAGNVPILINASRGLPKDDRVYGYLEKVFVEQYSANDLAAYRELEKKRRTVILDDYHNLRLKPHSRTQIIKRLASFADRLILIANDLVLAAGDLTDPEARDELDTPFKHYRIMPFGHVQRNRLIDNWLQLDSEAYQDREAYARQVIELDRTLDTLIGKNYVPSYPVYIISVLQSAEATAPIDTRASAHAHYYEIFIRTALARGRSRFEYDIMLGYLAHLAYRMFVDRNPSVDRTALEEIHKDYESRYDILRSFTQTVEQLHQQGILDVRDGCFSFRYSYLYYFFVASYIRDHIGEAAVRNMVSSMSRRLYVEEYANILLFLAHLSKDPLILAELIAAADQLYADKEPAALAGDIDFLNYLEPSSSEIVYVDEDTNVTRQEMLEAMDREEKSPGENTSALARADSEVQPSELEGNPLLLLNSGLKTLQILGQILKNFPGTMDGKAKLEVLSSCHNLGLRALTGVLSGLREDPLPLLRQIAQMVRAHHPKLDDERVAQRAKEIVVGMGRFISFGMIKQISNAVGSRDLVSTYQKLFSKTHTPAGGLTELSIALDHYGTFPLTSVLRLARDLQANALGMSVLRYLVVQHFYLFPVTYQTKQAVCQELGISYRGIRGQSSQRKLLTS